MKINYESCLHPSLHRLIIYSFFLAEEQRERGRNLNNIFMSVTTFAAEEDVGRAEGTRT